MYQFIRICDNSGAKRTDGASKNLKGENSGLQWSLIALVAQNNNSVAAA